MPEVDGSAQTAGEDTQDDERYVVVRQVRSAIGQKPKVRGTLSALGLRGVGQQRVHRARPEIVGMIRKVEHLVEAHELPRGVIAYAAPPLQRAKSGRERHYTMGDLGSGRIAYTRGGEPFRVEDRQDGLVLGWLPGVSKKELFRRLYLLGSEGSSVDIVKYDDLYREEPWRGAFPEPILSSPRRVQLFRLDNGGDSISWDRLMGGADDGEILLSVRSNDSDVALKAIQSMATPQVASELVDVLKKRSDK